MRKVVENILNNDKISDRSKQLLKENFDEMFEMLEKRGFIQYVKFQRLAKDAKTLIVQEVDDNTDLLSDNAAAGYRVLFNRMILKKSHFSNKLEISEDSTHESYHFCSRWSKLPTYIDEGVSQLLTVLTKGIQNRRYIQNTQFAAFLLSFMGNSIIKSYFTGNNKYFEKDLHDILSEEIGSETDRNKMINEFYAKLDRRHERKNGSIYIFEDLEEDEQDKVIEETNEINEFVDTIIRCKFKQMAGKRVFNRNGEVDEEIVKKVITEKLKYYMPFKYDNYRREKGSIENDENELKWAVREFERIIMNNYNPKMKCMNCITYAEYCLIADGYWNEDIFKYCIDYHNMSVIEFSDYITNFATELEIPQEELKELCEKYMFKYLKTYNITRNDHDFVYSELINAEDVYNLVVSNIPRNKAVFDLLAKEITSTESKFRKIGDSEYVEQRDREFVYLKIEEDGTLYEETDLSKVKDIFKIGDSLESIRLINREDDYKGLRILNEEQFQKVEMVQPVMQEILYQGDIDLEESVRKMNFAIGDAYFLSELTEVLLQKRTRLQVMDLIGVLTTQELKDMADEIYDEAILNSGIRDREHAQDMEEYNERLYDYEHREDEDR